MPRRAAAPLDLTITAAAGKPLVPYLRRHLRAAHAVLKPSLAELSVALVGDATMADLHERFMGIPGPTDVLTFPLDEDARGRVTAGEVVVCVPEARRRAKAEGTDLRREVLLYALHGMLHLSGYDDQTPAEFARMHRAEDRILSQIGVGTVFTGANSGREGISGIAGKTRGGAAGLSKPDRLPGKSPVRGKGRSVPRPGKQVSPSKTRRGDAVSGGSAVQSRPPARRGARAPADRPKR